MLSAHETLLAALLSLSKEQIQQAGHRYTPGVDPDAPNLRIESLFSAIENVACGAAALARFELTLDSLSEAWTQAKGSSQQPNALEAKLADARAFLTPMMNRMRQRDATAGTEWMERIAGIEAGLIEDMNHWRDEESRLPPSDRDTGYSSAQSTIRSHMSAIGRCLTVVANEREYIQSPEFKVLFDPKLLISGAWGTGKTHLLCDVTQERIGRDQATVLVLAKNFEGNVVEEICSRVQADTAAEEVFDRLAELANESAGRTIFILDGVNEGRRREWRDAVTELLRLADDRPNIGLIVTCRTPFEPIAIEQNDLERFHKVVHYGFDDQEFDAQAAFFQYYDLPLPEVPLLDREFSRPLTLKLICQSLQSLTGKKLAKGFSGIASGQKGMTFVLESFVKRVGEPIEQEFDLATKGCWLLLKGSDQIKDSRFAGFAPCMAANMRGYVRPSEADRIVAAHYPLLKPAQRRQLLEALRTNGLIEEDAIWYSASSGYKSRIVLRLPYQRFSDHLIARHLLKTHLDFTSIDTIKQSLTGKAPLARIFKMRSRFQREYAEPGWAQALITEFPERAGKRLPDGQRELYFVLPKQAQSSSAYFEPFIEGIFWRDPAAFTEGTRTVINHYLTANSRTWEQMVDALAAVSTKPKHPYHSRRLYDYLAGFPMPERDLQWSEYLRRRYASPTIHRLLIWAQKLNVAHMTPESAGELVVLLSLVLTTVVRRDRDLATKALVMIGERFPEVLFAHVVTSLEFNDPYVPERVLAAAYGTTMSLVDSELAVTFRPLLGTLAKILYESMFAPHAHHATHHTLTRGYAVGIIRLAIRAECVDLPERAAADLAAPFSNTPSKFASNGTPDPAVTEAIDNAIQMDFGNYTMGRLIRHRANYDNKHTEYVRVRAKIERRIYDLGYRADRFETADRDIGSTSWQARDEVKVDRYGKKYSWIAFFEMWGEREANRTLPDWRLGERTSDCGVDPSFPKRPPEWIPPIPDLFGRVTKSANAWVQGGFTPNWHPLLLVPSINGHQGPWVLLQGHVRGADETHDRDIFAFLRGMFVARKDVESLKTKFLAVDYPGNSRIPEAGTENYLYAGEAGRSQTYARHLYQRNGLYRRQVVEAFVEHVQEGPKKRAKRPPVTVDLITNAGKTPHISFADLLGPRPKFRRIPGIRLELPSIHFGWESYHSPHNEFSGFDLPAPGLIQRLGLASKNREIDFYDSLGKPGTLYREAGDSWKGDRHSLLYIRADLLQRYLSETRQVLVWCNWGEREWLKKMDGHHPIRDSARQKIYQAHKHIHRSFSQWSAKDSRVI